MIFRIQGSHLLFREIPWFLPDFQIFFLDIFLVFNKTPYLFCLNVVSTYHWVEFITELYTFQNKNLPT